MRDEHVMTPEDRKQLLEEQGRLLDFHGGDKPTGKPPVSEVTEEEWARKEKKRQDEDAALLALRNKPQSVGQVLAENVAICRKALDQRVILGAAEIGMDNAETEQMKVRMKRWAEAVTLKPDGETHEQRKLRLQTLHRELYSEKSRPGCGCDGKGWRFTAGTMHLKDDRIERDAEFYRLCECDRGIAKLDEVKHMGKPRNAVRGRGKKADKADAVPF